MTDSTKVTFMFHCGDYEQEHIFKTDPTDEELMDRFDDWAFQYGYGSDELDDMFDSGEAGYYQI